VAVPGAVKSTVGPAEQAHLSDLFAAPGREPVGSLAELNVPHALYHTGTPVLHGCAGFFDCTLARVYDGGDHTIFVGDVQAVGADPHKQPLLYFSRGYRRFAMS
jgi:flavin reductase (DIM6/NTAB) family NADH-FMN oxidoreductase RutF